MVKFEINLTSSTTNTRKAGEKLPDFGFVKGIGDDITVMTNLFKVEKMIKVLDDNALPTAIIANPEKIKLTTEDKKDFIKRLNNVKDPETAKKILKDVNKLLKLKFTKPKSISLRNYPLTKVEALDEEEFEEIAALAGLETMKYEHYMKLLEFLFNEETLKPAYEQLGFLSVPTLNFTGEEKEDDEDIDLDDLFAD